MEGLDVAFVYAEDEEFWEGHFDHCDVSSFSVSLG